MLLVLLATYLSTPADVFRSPEACASAIASGEHLTRANGLVRVVTWNVRWFPDGEPGKSPTGHTNIAWLACALKWLDADAVMLQEVKRLPHAVAAMQQVVAALGSHWVVHADDCPDASRQHIVLLVRGDRLEVSNVATRGDIDPTTVKNGTPACPGRLRPALTAYLRSRRGGLDFHLAGVHLDSGKEARDHDDRIAAWGRLPLLSEAMRAAAPDDDVIVLGDFNTMGCKGCTHGTPHEEIGALADAALHLPLPFRLASRDLACSEYYHQHGTALDHVLISATMQEADDATARVSGVCDALSCERMKSEWSSALAGLSDHCPVVLDLADKDVD